MNYKDPIQIIKDKAASMEPKVGIILGSGLGDFVSLLEDPISFFYSEFDGFPEVSVVGHSGKLVLGGIGDTSVAVLQGRVHYYEYGRADIMKLPLQTLAGLGCKSIILTNTSGSIDQNLKPGNIGLITDHINFSGTNPLIGETDPSRFVNMVNAYDQELCTIFRAIADQHEITLHNCIYIWFSGPSFETPAEIHAARLLGAQLVGMSTVPEVILARRAGLKVAALSVISNMAAGMSSEQLSHKLTLTQAQKGTADLQTLLIGYLSTLT